MVTGEKSKSVTIKSQLYVSPGLENQNAACSYKKLPNLVFHNFFSNANCQKGVQPFLDHSFSMREEAIPANDETAQVLRDLTFSLTASLVLQYTVYCHIFEAQNSQYLYILGTQNYLLN